jgi:hypothetical protein
MANVAAVITWIALAGALTSFIAGAVLSVRALEGASLRRRVFAIVAWPFTLARLKTAEQSTRINKALVAFMACLMIAAAAWSAAANLHRFAR